MFHVYGRSLIGALFVAACIDEACAQDRAPAPTAAAVCRFEPAGVATVKDVPDGRTLALADGREVRLAGIETPADGPGSTAAQAALAALVPDRSLLLTRLGAEHDRYGRLLAYPFATNAERPLQHALVATGHARVAAHIGDVACATELLKAEQAARAAQLGIWASPHYVVHGADNPAGVLAERGRFTLVEGRVLSVRETGGTIYMNFGRRWSEDFTVTVPKRIEKTFTSAGLELKKLSGRRVRVRGYVEERGGPWIEAIRPGQIEIAEN